MSANARRDSLFSPIIYLLVLWHDVSRMVLKINVVFAYFPQIFLMHGITTSQIVSGVRYLSVISLTPAATTTLSVY